MRYYFFAWNKNGDLNKCNASFESSELDDSNLNKFSLNTIGGRWYFGRVYVPLRLKSQSLYHKILLLQKFNENENREGF